MSGCAADCGPTRFLVAVALYCAGCGGTVDVERQAPAVLARVDTSVITEVDFDEALSQWESDGASDTTTATWRQRLQLLIDRQLLILEARQLGFYDDPRVLREVEVWERSRVIPELLETEVGDADRFTEDELHAFYYGAGANRELLVGRLVLEDSVRATAALRDVRAQMPFSRVIDVYAAAERRTLADSIWLNSLAITDGQLASLLSRWVEDAEIFSRDGRYLVAVVLDERSVALEERRPLAEEAFRRERQKEANLAYLASLMKKYDVYVDNVTLNRLSAGVSQRRLDPKFRLVCSSLGDWTVGQYRAAVAQLVPAGRPVSGSLRDLKLRVLRTYAVDQLLPREVEAKGLGPGLARRRKTIREQKAIEALWAAKGLTRVAVTEMELRRYFEANRDRYVRDFTGPTAAAGVRAKVLRDLKEKRAVPLFDEYVAELRGRYRHGVFVDPAQFRAYLARKTGASSFPPALNGCDQLTAVDETERGEIEIRFGGELGYAYQPSCVAVSSGTIVVFVGDFGAHPLVTGSIHGQEVVPDDASPLWPTAAGGQAKFLMTGTGSHGYFCDRHVAEAMMGAIFVE